MTRHHVSNGTFTTEAPRRSIASSLVCGAPTADPAIRSRAARISSGRGGSTAFIAPPPEVDRDPGPALESSSIDVVSRGEILDREPERLEQGDLLLRAPAGNAPQEHAPDLADDVILADRSLGSGDEEVPGLVERGLEPIHIEPRALDGRRVQLAPGRERGADRVDVGARRDPVSTKDR